MRVVISVPGKFHAYDLARELNKRGLLEHIFTSYPGYKVRSYGISGRLTSSILAPEIIARTWRKMPRVLRGVWDPRYFVSSLYDKAVKRGLVDCDVCVAWSGYGLETIKQAKRLGAKTVLERGSSHIVYQTEILQEEYKKFGATPEQVHPDIFNKELQEYKEADFIAVPSLFTKKTFLDRGFPEEKILQVPYGVDLATFKQIPKKDSLFRVVFAGGMSLRKGVHYLLRAFAELELPNSELLLIGGMNEEMRPFFKKYEGKFKYIGKVPQEKLHEHLSNGSVFAIASIEEGLALVIPQAMACGLPVIATTNTGAEDIVRDGKDGFVIPIRDVDFLKSKILDLYNNPNLCREMGNSAKARVLNGFSWNDYGNKIVAAYENIISGHGF